MQAVACISQEGIVERQIPALVCSESEGYRSCVFPCNCSIEGCGIDTEGDAFRFASELVHGAPIHNPDWLDYDRAIGCYAVTITAYRIVDVGSWPFISAGHSCCSHKHFKPCAAIAEGGHVCRELLVPTCGDG